MAVKEIKGNLLQLALDGQFDYIIHGANCHCKFGAGIAYQVAQLFPEAYQADRRTSIGDVKKLGNFTTALVKRSIPTETTPKKVMFTIINLYTQYIPGPDFREAALKIGLFKLAKIIPKGARIGLPWIGAGIGGGEWTRIREIIVTEFVTHDVTIVEFEKPTDAEKKEAA